MEIVAAMAVRIQFATGVHARLRRFSRAPPGPKY